MNLSNILTLLLTCCTLTILGQEPFLINYNSNDGLPSNECYDILQDPDGFIWIGTDMGLAKFDGSVFQTYSTHDGLLDNIITGVFCNDSGTIYSHTFRKGYSQIKDGDISIPDWQKELDIEVTISDDLLGLSDDTILLAMATSSAEGPHWVKIAPNGTIIKREYPESAISRISHFQHNNRSAAGIRNLPNSSMLIINQNGKTDTIRSMHSERINDATISHSGTVAFSSGKTLYCFKNGQLTHTDLPTAVLNSLFIDSENNLWAGTMEGGVYCFENSDLNQQKHHFLKEMSVTAIIEDRNGGFWFTTVQEGLYQMPFDKIGVFKSRDRLNGERATRSCLVDSILWIGCRDGLLASIDLKKRIEVREVHNYRYIFSMTNNYGQLVVGVDKEEIEATRSEYKEIEPARSIHFINDSTWLTASAIGISLYENERLKQKYQVPNKSTRFSGITTDVQGNLWTSSSNGVYTFDPELELLEQKSFGPTIDKQRISQILFQADVGVISVYGSGLILFSDEDTLHLTTESGLPSNFINSIKLYENEIWLATSNGMVRLEPGDNGELKPSIHPIGLEFGLLSSNVNDLQFISDSVWAITDGGISVIPLSILQNTAAQPDLYIRSFSSNGETLDFKQGPVLEASQNNVEIELGAISFINQTALRYAYRFKNAEDTTWTLSSQNTINLLELSPGNYDMEIKAITSLNQHTPISTISFMIQSPLWKRWYFMLTIISIIACSIYTVVMYRMKKLRKEAQLIQEVNALEHQALRAQMNPHFIYNALNTIQNFIIHENKDASIRYLSRFSKLIRSIFDHSSMEWVTLESEIESIILYSELELARYPGKYEFELKSPEHAGNMKVPPLIMQPFIENAILHGVLPMEGKGKISLSIKRQSDYIQIIVEDNGIGINKGLEIKQRKATFLEHVNRTNSSGMSVTKTRILQICKKYNVRPFFHSKDLSDEAPTLSGTRIKFNLPILYNS